MLANLYPIKNANGLLWYAIDYLRGAPPGTLVVCRAEFTLLIKNQLPHANVIDCHGAALAKYLIRTMLKRRRLVTFTPHPLPMYGNQVVIVHDDFPFLGRSGPLKRTLFRVGTLMSGCKVGYINRSNALRFVDAIRVRQDRRFFAPNRTPVVSRPVRSAPLNCSPGTIGLFGTDSPKKQYHMLLDSAQRLGKIKGYRFRFYGIENAYTQSLRREFPHADFEIVDSSEVSMPSFLQNIDAAVSSSRGEGFGRPLAMALTLGIPTFLLESDTFREFFDGSAVFYSHVDELWEKLVNPANWGVGANWEAMRKDINDAADKAAAEIWDAE
jgi:glycosyltransferase involved in cell wall biosynthesis